MTDPTTTPTPPEGLTDERLLELAAAAIDGYDSIAPGEFEPETWIAVEAYGSELLAYARAAIAAHEAARPAPAPVPTFLDAIRLANGCHDYSGGYGGAEGEAWHAAIGTVVDVLRRAATRPWDSQTAAVFAMGEDTPDPAPAPTPEELQARYRAWFQQEHGLTPSSTATAHAADFALHLLGRGVQA